ncbi:MAG: ABC transporter ATP-binding protein [Actinomycetota bacterium]|nr:ABC transporter ATP-binding protein [Actinomycetota bacterium]
MDGWPVIEVEGLRKTFRGLRGRRRLALDGLDMVVPAGGVHGFLGPNGSGKTTTIRILLGLVHADAGTMRLLGRTVPRDLPAVIGSIGAVVETPQFFPAFSGRRNLRLLAGVAGVRKRRVEEVLDAVGLQERAADRYKSYSLGMKQRLAIAATLLKAPQLLILDEPTNGLDPAGMREVRDTMRRLAAEGTTVLLSTHLLSEVQQVCDSVTILARGRHIRSGTVHDVLAYRGGGQLRVRVADLVAGERVLAADGFSVRREWDHLLVDWIDDAARLSKSLASQGLYVSELAPVNVDLESVFLELTGTDQPGVPVGLPAPERSR